MTFGNDDDLNQPSKVSLIVKEGTNGRRAMAFLAANDGHAYTRNEIRDGTGISDGSIGPVLTRLADDGLLHRHGGQWTLAEEGIAALESEGLLDELREEWNAGW
ncbi:MarR family transcriptional regulator [Haladaptatus caseinilyticus]|uniref:MarR family transcriptional regulator n=1 Tax=Haladaptatus caseinilyticus TaxID=2993314 RepID=UPI00224B1FBD|nr:MarR family transcriptional regulator [Haladaptatus caseinilyticus]